MLRNIAQRRKNSFNCRAYMNGKGKEIGNIGRKEGKGRSVHPPFLFRLPSVSDASGRWPSFRPLAVVLPFRPEGFRSSVLPLRPSVRPLAFRLRSVLPAFSRPFRMRSSFPSVWKRTRHKATRKPHEAKQTHGGFPVSFRHSRDEGGGEGGRPHFVPSHTFKGGHSFPSLFCNLIPMGGLLFNIPSFRSSFVPEGATRCFAPFRSLCSSCRFLIPSREGCCPAYSRTFLVGRGKYSLPKTYTVIVQKRPSNAMERENGAFLFVTIVLVRSCI